MATGSTVLLITSNNDLLSHVAQSFATTDINAVVISIEAAEVDSPTYAPQFQQLSVSPASLCSADFLARLFRTSSTSAVLMDFSSYSNELGISTAFLMALTQAEFAGHLIYLSTFGDLLAGSAESRALREAWPVKAAVEHQLQSQHTIGGAQIGFSWTVLGPSSPISTSPPPTQRSPSSSLSPVDTRQGSGQTRSRASSSTSLSSVVDLNTSGSPGRLSPSSGATSRVSMSDVADAVLRAVEDGGRTWNGKKVMLSAREEWTVSFMHQTDWEGKYRPTCSGVFESVR